MKRHKKDKPLRKSPRKMPAIPPEDYKGSVGRWMIELQERGLWDGDNPTWHGDVMIEVEVWREMVKKLER